MQRKANLCSRVSLNLKEIKFKDFEFPYFFKSERTTEQTKRAEKENSGA